VSIAAGYDPFSVGSFFQVVSPAWSEFLAKGTLAMVIVRGILLDSLVGGVLNKARALRSFETTRRSRDQQPGPWFDPPPADLRSTLWRFVQIPAPADCRYSPFLGAPRGFFS
jgi:hypothetical protein